MYEFKNNISFANLKDTIFAQQCHMNKISDVYSVFDTFQI